MATPTNQRAVAAARHPAAAHHSVLPHWLINLGGLGLFAVAIVDSSPVPLPLPGSTDFLLLLLVSHRGNPFLLAACAAAGSAIGGYLTWSTGKKGGDTLLERSVPPRFRKRLERWTNEHSMLSVVLPAMMPPPIPLMPFLLAAGALGVSRRRFLIAYNAARLARYGLVAWAGVVYGRTVVRWWTNTLAGWSGIIAWSFAVAFVGAIAYGIWRYRRLTQTAREDKTSADAVPAR